VERLRVAVVGAGLIAGVHVAALGRLGAGELVAVCDVDEDRARALAEPAGAASYADWEELLVAERPDAMWVCTPPLVHRDPAVAALEAGLHVFLEKPVARTLDDAAAIVAAAERSEAVCAVGYQWRAVEVLERLRDLLAGQSLGLLAGRSFGPAHPRPWFLDRRQGGGNVLERASHQIDLQRAVAGEVTSVQAAAGQVALAEEAGGDVEHEASLVLRFAGGGLGTVDVAWTRGGLPGVYELDVLASEATLRLTLDPDFNLLGTARGKRVEALTTQHPFERGVARFLEAVAAGDRDAVFCTPRDAAGTLAVAVACEEALAGGGTVDVPELATA
jgi:myo-inositol 2-dehydrogenase/D-chiro-inositol 1-dehydrogenase